ncbi:MAG: hypothetical protein V4819_11805 [Verrucomicrobiota bacterium]
MTPDSDPLVETAVRPFADNAEMQLAASRLLSDLTESNDGSAAGAIQHWDAMDARTRKPVWRTVLFSVMAVVSAITVVNVARDTLQYVGLYSSMTKFVSVGSDKRHQQKLENSLTTPQRLLVFGDSSQPTRAGKMKALWDSAPENPAYFGEYAKAYLSDNDRLPPDFLETARRVDPRNSWFTYLAAAVECKGSVEKRKQSKAAKDAGEVRTWNIRDKSKLERALVLLQEARSQPECRDYVRILAQQRIEILPRDNPTDNLHSIAYLAGSSSPDIIAIRHLMDAIGAKGWTLGEEADAEGLKSLIGDSDAFVAALASIEVSNMIEVLVFKVCADGTSKDLGAAAAKLGLAADAARLTETHRRFDAHKLARESRKPSPDRVRPETNGALLASLSLPMVARQMVEPPPLTDDEVKPGRLADHEIFSRASCIGVWILLMVIFCGAAAYRYRSPVLIRRLAKRMEALMLPADWAWLLGVGLLMPLAYMMILNRLTPLGGRQFGLHTTLLLLPAAHFLGLTVLMILLPVLITRWRLGKRAAVFGFANSRSRLGWFAAACAVAFVPVVGWGACAGSEVGLAVAAGLIAVPALWLLVVMLRAIFSKPSKMLHRSTSARVLLPVYATAMLLMVSLAPVYKAAGQRWFERDTLIRLDPAYPSMTRYEYEAAVQMRKELRELLGMD